MRRSALLLACLALAGCSGGEDEATPTLPAEPPRAGDIGPALRFVNSSAARARRGWAQSPITTAARFLTVVGTDAETTTMSVPRPEFGRRAVVTVTQESLLDDSVRAVRYRLVLRRRADGTWRIFSAARTQRCWAGRGHENFSGAPCV